MIRSRLTMAALMSASRRSAEAISTGWMPLRKVLAKAPLTARSRPFSKLSSSPTGLLWHGGSSNIVTRCAGYAPFVCPPAARIGLLHETRAGRHGLMQQGDSRGMEWGRSACYSREVEFLEQDSRASGGVGGQLASSGSLLNDGAG